MSGHRLNVQEINPNTSTQLMIDLARNYLDALTRFQNMRRGLWTEAQIASLQEARGLFLKGIQKLETVKSTVIEHKKHDA